MKIMRLKGGTIAQLNDEDRWESTDKSIEEVLNIFTELQGAPHPSEGNPRNKVFYSVVDRFDGEVAVDDEESEWTRKDRAY